jgi:hypothetical protein
MGKYKIVFTTSDARIYKTLIYVQLFSYRFEILYKHSIQTITNKSNIY